MTGSLSRSVSGAMFWNVLFQPVLMLLSLATSVVVVRLLGLHSYGIIVIIGATVTTLMNWNGLGYGATLLRFLPELAATRGSKDLARVLRRFFLLRAGMAAAMVLLVYLGGRRVASILSIGQDAVAFINATLLIFVIETFRSFFEIFLQGFFRHRDVRATDAVKQSLYPLLVFGFVWDGLQVAEVIYATILSSFVALVVAVVFSARLMRQIRRAEDLRQRDTIHPAGPLRTRMIKYASYSVVEQSLGYFASSAFFTLLLSAILGPEAVSIFGLANQFVDKATALVEAPFRRIFVPLFAALRWAEHNKVQKAFRVSVKTISLLVMPSAQGIFLLTAAAMSKLYPSDFMPAVPAARLLTILWAASWVLSSVSGTLLLTFERYRIMMLCLLISLASPIGLISLGHRAGLQGCIALFYAPGLVVATVRLILSMREFGLSYPIGFVRNLLICCAVSSLPALPFYLSGLLGTVWGIVLAFVCCLLFLGIYRLLGGIDEESSRMLQRSGIPLRNLLARVLSKSAFNPGEGS